jgi:hypothetical protein
LPKVLPNLYLVENELFCVKEAVPKFVSLDFFSKTMPKVTIHPGSETLVKLAKKSFALI